MVLEWGTYEVRTSCLGHWQKKQETPLETLCELFVMAMTNGRYLETFKLFGGMNRNLIWEALATNPWQYTRLKLVEVPYSLHDWFHLLTHSYILSPKLLLHSTDSLTWQSS